ncbi:MAG: peptidase [Planctomycetes bacterium]|nr:peptidase [Planctomycetota bacterium]
MPAAAPTVASLAVLGFLSVAAAQVPSPEAFFGHEIGADHRLVNYTDLARWLQAVERGSDRVRLVDIGPTSYGQRMTMAAITAPANLARLERLQAISRQLAQGRMPAAAARELAVEGRAVVWIDGGLHATEAIAGQNVLELVWQMTSRDDGEVRRILDEVVLLVCPVNPDGYELVANAYRATRSMTIPVLYQRFVGHDNNRDFYACNQPEAQNVNRVFYREWCPQIVYNHHQSAPAGTILFTPPFRDPHNYLVDPLVIRGIEIVAAHMNHRFALEGKPGVISRSGAPYSGWWNGGLRSTGYFHNVIGILTEAFGRPEPTPLRPALARRLPSGDHPDPVPAQTWRARQTIDYLQTANFAILDFAARHREELLLGIWTMASRAIERGSRDHWTPTPRLLAAAARRSEPESVFADPLLRDPRAYVLRSDQQDWGAAQRLARALWRCGVEVQRATAPFDLGGATMPAGSLVVRCDQAYRAHVLDQFEPQWHPDDVQDGRPVPPYDSAGWTLALQMDVQVERCFSALHGPFAPVADGERFAPQPLAAAAAGWQLDPRDSHALVAVNRLLAAGAAVEWSPRGHYWVPRGDRALAVLRAAADELGLRALGREVATREAREPVRAPRLGLFDVFGGHMPTGWDHWLLREFGFPVRQVWGDRVEAGDLGRDFDVLVFHTGLPGPRDLERAARRVDEQDLPTLRAALPPFEDWSDLEARAVRLTGERSLPALREFVEQGGTLVALGGECDKVVRHFALPVRVGTYVPDPLAEGGERRARREEFYVPGSLLALEIDRGHELARGSSGELAAMVTGNSAMLEVVDPAAPIEVVARYRRCDPLLSGWAIGEQHLAGKAAVLCARVGRGRVLLYGPDVTYRGQPLGTARLFFQGVLTAGR